MADQVFNALFSGPHSEGGSSGFPCHTPTRTFHFATDYMVAQWEILFEEAGWVRTDDRSRATFPGYLSQEEKLANAYMLKAFRAGKPALKIKGKTEALRKFTLEQPEGYRDGSLVKSADWDRELRLLSREFLNDMGLGEHYHLWGEPPGFDFASLYPIHPKVDWRYCPIHLIRDDHRLMIP
jgi:hypothetical protein